MISLRFVTIIGMLLACAFMGAPIAAADDGTQTDLAAAARGESAIDITTYVADAEASVDQFATLNGLVHAHWVNLSGSQTAQSACNSAASAYNAFFYCARDGLTYIGTINAEQFNDGTDYLAGALLIAHEWGHNLQHAVAPGRPPSKERENGADCVGGAWLRWFNDTQGLGLNLGNAMGFWNLAVMVEAPVEWNDVHGTRFERGQAMLNGYIGGLGACNGYTPTV